MIRSMQVKDFKSIPYLESSAVIVNHPQGLTFSLDKPTVIIGPNGSGKSSVIKTLAVRFLADVLGYSAFDADYVGSDSPYWSCTESWREDWLFLSGLQCDTDNAPALYYHPRHIPGNESTVACAMVMGLCEDARAYGKRVEKKSSGEGNRNRLTALYESLDRGAATEYRYARWRYGKEPVDLRARGPGCWYGAADVQAEKLKELFSTYGTHPLILMDEPEDSLDARAELQLWQRVCKESGAQSIIATHSLYPVLHPEKFNVIETVPGYVQSVSALL